MHCTELYELRFNVSGAVSNCAGLHCDALRCGTAQRYSAARRCTALQGTVLRCTERRCTTLPCNAIRCAALCIANFKTHLVWFWHNAQRSTALHCTALYGAARQRTALYTYYAILRCTALHGAALRCTALRYDRDVTQTKPKLLQYIIS